MVTDKAIPGGDTWSRISITKWWLKMGRQNPWQWSWRIQSAAAPLARPDKSSSNATLANAFCRRSGRRVRRSVANFYDPA